MLRLGAAVLGIGGLAREDEEVVDVGPLSAALGGSEVAPGSGVGQLGDHGSNGNANSGDVRGGRHANVSDRKQSGHGKASIVGGPGVGRGTLTLGDAVVVQTVAQLPLKFVEPATCGDENAQQSSSGLKLVKATILNDVHVPAGAVLLELGGLRDAYSLPFERLVSEMNGLAGQTVPVAFSVSSETIARDTRLQEFKSSDDEPSEPDDVWEQMQDMLESMRAELDGDDGAQNGGGTPSTKQGHKRGRKELFPGAMRFETIQPYDSPRKRTVSHGERQAPNGRSRMQVVEPLQTHQHQLSRKTSRRQALSSPSSPVASPAFPVSFSDVFDSSSNRARGVSSLSQRQMMATLAEMKERLRSTIDERNLLRKSVIEKTGEAASLAKDLDKEQSRSRQLSETIKVLHSDKDRLADKLERSRALVESGLGQQGNGELSCANAHINALKEELFESKRDLAELQRAVESNDADGDQCPRASCLVHRRQEEMHQRNMARLTERNLMLENGCADLKARLVEAMLTAQSGQGEDRQERLEKANRALESSLAKSKAQLMTLQSNNTALSAAKSFFEHQSSMLRKALEKTSVSPLDEEQQQQEEHEQDAKVAPSPSSSSLLKLCEAREAQLDSQRSEYEALIEELKENQREEVARALELQKEQHTMQLQNLVASLDSKSAASNLTEQHGAELDRKLREQQQRHSKETQDLVSTLEKGYRERLSQSAEQVTTQAALITNMSAKIKKLEKQKEDQSADLKKRVLDAETRAQELDMAKTAQERDRLLVIMENNNAKQKIAELKAELEKINAHTRKMIEERECFEAMAKRNEHKLSIDKSSSSSLSSSLLPPPPSSSSSAADAADVPTTPPTSPARKNQVGPRIVEQLPKCALQHAESAQAQVQVWKADATSLRKSVEQLSLKLSEADAKVKKANEEACTERQRASDLQAQLDIGLGRIAKQSSAPQLSRAGSSEKEAGAAIMRAELEELRLLQSQQMEEIRASFQNRLDAGDEQSARLESLLQVAAKEEQSLRAELEMQREQTAMCAEELATRCASLAEFKSRCNALEASADTNRTRAVADANGQFHSVLTKVEKEFENDVEQLKHQLRARDESISRFLVECRENEAQVEGLRRQVAVESNRSDIALQQLAMQAVELEAAKSQLQAVQAESKQARSTLEEDLSNARSAAQQAASERNRLLEERNHALKEKEEYAASADSASQRLEEQVSEHNLALEQAERAQALVVQQASAKVEAAEAACHQLKQDKEECAAQAKSLRRELDEESVSHKLALKERDEQIAAGLEKTRLLAQTKAKLEAAEAACQELESEKKVALDKAASQPPVDQELLIKQAEKAAEKEAVLNQTVAKLEMAQAACRKLEQERDRYVALAESVAEGRDASSLEVVELKRRLDDACQDLKTADERRSLLESERKRIDCSLNDTQAALARADKERSRLQVLLDEASASDESQAQERLRLESALDIAKALAAEQSVAFERAAAETAQLRDTNEELEKQVLSLKEESVKQITELTNRLEHSEQALEAGEKARQVAVLAEEESRKAVLQAKEEAERAERIASIQVHEGEESARKAMAQAKGELVELRTRVERAESARELAELAEHQQAEETRVAASKAAELESELAALKEQSTASSSEKDGKEIQRLRASLITAQNNLQHEVKKCCDLAAKLRAAPQPERIQALEAQLASTKARLGKGEEELARCVGERNALLVKLSSANSSSRALRNQLDNVASLQSELDAANAKCVQAEQRAEAASQMASQAQGAKQAKEMELAQLGAVHQKLAQEVAAATAAREEASAQGVAMEEQTSSLKARLDKSEVALERAQEEIEHLRDTIAMNASEQKKDSSEADHRCEYDKLLLLSSPVTTRKKDPSSKVRNSGGSGTSIRSKKVRRDLKRGELERQLLATADRLSAVEEDRTRFAAKAKRDRAEWLEREAALYKEVAAWRAAAERDADRHSRTLLALSEEKKRRSDDLEGWRRSANSPILVKKTPPRKSRVGQLERAAASLAAASPSRSNNHNTGVFDSLLADMDSTLQRLAPSCAAASQKQGGKQQVEVEEIGLSCVARGLYLKFAVEQLEETIQRKGLARAFLALKKNL